VVTHNNFLIIIYPPHYFVTLCTISLVPRRPDLFNARERERGSLVSEITCVTFR
jgi:hypothetical protein